ncbi:MAG TPA: alpha/beta hydrolase [Phenylobacterium sp.]|jgi:pimeloyl-ACP methyl ester carboxylesterase|nr:alpha/beta hydrolase [Phenylobacterium sp.]
MSGGEDPRTFVPHGFPEQTADLGEVAMNYVVAGEASKPALLLIPGQTESWWGYEAAIPLLQADFQVFAVDLRGQGRSTWTPGRYTLDNMGNDLARFIATVVKRPVVTSGCSSGGVLSGWLAAYALPGQLRGAILEDPPLFASELTPACGPSIRQSVVGPIFERFASFLGPQWRIGDYGKMSGGAEPPQNLREYDPEWAKAFVEGTVAASCRHDAMLAAVRVPVLLTHHSRQVDEATGRLFGALTDQQARRAGEIVKEAGQAFDYVSLPDAAHAMHAAQPERFASVVRDWALALPA